MTIPEAARRFGVKKRTLRSWVNRGIITRYRSKVGRIYVDPAEVAARKRDMETIERDPPK